jgi:DNA-binding Xre family transcriptional regulator
VVTKIAEDLQMPLKCLIQQRIFEYEARVGERFIKKDAAAKLGMMPQQFSALVTGKAYTTAEKMFKLADMLGCKVDDLYEYIEEE